MILFLFLLLIGLHTSHGMNQEPKYYRRVRQLKQVDDMTHYLQTPLTTQRGALHQYNLDDFKDQPLYTLLAYTALRNQPPLDPLAEGGHRTGTIYCYTKNQNLFANLYGLVRFERVNGILVIRNTKFKQTPDKRTQQPIIINTELNTIDGKPFTVDKEPRKFDPIFAELLKIFAPESIRIGLLGFSPDLLRLQYKGISYQDVYDAYFDIEMYSHTEVVTYFE